MDHEEAQRVGAAEKYLLDQLGEDERAQYEEHFFECGECAEELKVTELFLAGARKALAGEARPERPVRAPWWRTLLWPMPVAAWAAIAVLLGVVAYQSFGAVPRLREELALAQAPQPASWHFLAVTRGEPPAIVASPELRMVGLTLGRPPGPILPSYRCEVREASGRVVWSFAVPGPQHGDEIQLVIPAAKLRPGAYVIVLAAPDGGEAELARYPFTVQEGGE